MNDTLPPSKRRAIMLLSVAAVASGAAGRICDSMLVDLEKAFSVTPEAAAHSISIFAVAYGLVQAVFGPLGDRIGKYLLISLSTLACVLGAAGCLVAQSLDQLVAARVLNAIAAAGIVPLSMAWIGDHVPYNLRQATLARYLIGQLAGVMIGQLAGGFFTEHYGWRSAFGFLTLLALIAGLLMLREWRVNPEARLNPTPPAERLGLIGQVREVLAQPWARTVLVAVFCEGAALFGALALVPTDLHLRFGISLTEAGAAVALFAIGGLGYIIIAPRLVKGRGEIWLARYGAMLIAASLIGLAVTPVWGLAAPLSFLTGLGFYMIHNTLQTNATQMAPQVRGTAMSLFASCYFSGQAAGVALSAALMARFGGPAVFVGCAIVAATVGMAFAYRLTAKARLIPE